MMLLMRMSLCFNHESLGVDMAIAVSYHRLSFDGHHGLQET